MEAGYSPYSDQSGNMDQVVICKNIVNGQLRFPPQYNSDCKVIFLVVVFVDDDVVDVVDDFDGPVVTMSCCMFPPYVVQRFQDLVKKLLTREVANRLGNLKGGADDIKAHKWFTGVDAEAYYKKTIRAPWLVIVLSVSILGSRIYHCFFHFVIDNFYFLYKNYIVSLCMRVGFLL